jgi:hypothetical protein
MFIPRAFRHCCDRLKAGNLHRDLVPGIPSQGLDSPDITGDLVAHCVDLASLGEKLTIGIDFPLPGEIPLRDIDMPGP